MDASIQPYTEKTVTDRLRLAISADLNELPALAAAFEAWTERAQLPQRTVFAANLAVEELVVNVVTQGRCEARRCTIVFLARREPSCLVIELRNDAPAFDPFQAAAPHLRSDLGARPVGGVGVHFVRTLMDCWTYVREGNENVVRLIKRVGGVVADGGGSR